MKRTKSKLDLIKLQATFDELLDNFTKEDLNSWKHYDLELQSNQLFEGKSIDVVTNPVKYVPINGSISDLLEIKPNNYDFYENAA
jgi:hypothetical protein